MSNKGLESAKNKNSHRIFLYFSTKKKVYYPHVKKINSSKEMKYALSLVEKERRRQFLISRFLLKSAYPKFSNYSFLNHEKEKSIIWPPSFTGSLSHKNSHFAFTIEPKKEVTESYGIDLENLNVSEKVYHRISSHSEGLYFDSLATSHPELSGIFWWSLVFSIKESLFKCFSPICGRKNLSLKKCQIKSLSIRNQTFEGHYESHLGVREKATGVFSLLKYKKKCCDNKFMVLSFCKTKVNN